MQLNEIRDLKDRTPFQPFALELDNGRRVNVPHGDHLFIPPNGRFVIVAGDEHLDIVEPSHVAALIVANGH